MSKEMLEISVTQKHIKNGEQANYESCAIALALKEKFDTEEVSVKKMISELIKITVLPFRSAGASCLP